MCFGVYFHYFLEHKLQLKASHGKREGFGSWYREKKGSLRPHRLFCSCYFSQKEKNWVFSSACFSGEEERLIINMWIKKKILYHSAGGTAGDPCPSTAIQQLLKKVTTRAGQIKQADFSSLKTSSKAWGNAFFLTSSSGCGPGINQPTDSIMPFHFKLDHSNVTLTSQVTF